MKKHYVYFIRPVGMLAPIKIGRSEAPKDRLSSLMSWSPFPLEIVATIEGDNSLELKLHTRFAHVRTHREWFLADVDLLRGVDLLIAGKSVEEAFDFNISKRRLSPRNRPIPSPGDKARSYRMRLHHLLQRLYGVNHSGNNWKPEVLATVRTAYKTGLNEADAKFLDAVLANPREYVEIRKIITRYSLPNKGAAA